MIRNKINYNPTQLVSVKAVPRKKSQTFIYLNEPLTIKGLLFSRIYPPGLYYAEYGIMSGKLVKLSRTTEDVVKSYDLQIITDITGTHVYHKPAVVCKFTGEENNTYTEFQTEEQAEQFAMDCLKKAGIFPDNIIQFNQ